MRDGFNPPATETEPAAGTGAHGLPDRMLWASVLLGSALSLALCYGIATRSVVLGSRAGGWAYKYVRDSTGHPLIVFLLATALAGALLLATVRASARREWSLVVAWVLAALVLQGLLRSLTPFSFDTIFASDGANAFHSVAEDYDAWTVLNDFSSARKLWPTHAQSNRPGKLMLVHALRLISTRPDMLAGLVLVLSNLGGVLFYVFVRDLFDDRRVALFSLVLYLFVPAKLFFFPLLNTVTPVVLLCCGSLLLRMLLTGSAVYAALLGIALYGLVFFEPLPLVMGLMFAALVGRAFWRGDLSASRFLVLISVGVGGFGATDMAMYLWFGFDLINAFQQVAAHAVAFNAGANRPYSTWVWWNLSEFLFGVGACQAVVFAAALLDGLRGPGEWFTRLAHPVTVLCLSLVAVLLATDVIGVNRGEVIRLWIFLACFFQIPTAYVCARLQSTAAMLLVLAATMLQIALGTAMIGFVVP